LHAWAQRKPRPLAMASQHELLAAAQKRIAGCAAPSARVHVVKTTSTFASSNTHPWLAPHPLHRTRLVSCNSAKSKIIRQQSVTFFPRGNQPAQRACNYALKRQAVAVGCNARLGRRADGVRRTHAGVRTQAHLRLCARMRRRARALTRSRRCAHTKVRGCLSAPTHLRGRPCVRAHARDISSVRARARTSYR